MAKGQATSDDTLERVAVRGGLHSGAALAAPPGPLPHDRGHRVFRPSRPPHLYFRMQQSRSIRRVVNSGLPVTSRSSSLSRVLRRDLTNLRRRASQHPMRKVNRYPETHEGDQF